MHFFPGWSRIELIWIMSLLMTMSPCHGNHSFTLKFTSLPEVSVWKMMEHVLTDLTGITQHPVSWLKLGRSILGCCAGWSWRKHCFQLTDLVTKSRSFLWSIWEDTELIYCYSYLCSRLSSNTKNPKRYLDPPFWCDMIFSLSGDVVVHGFVRRSVRQSSSSIPYLWDGKWILFLFAGLVLFEISDMRKWLKTLMCNIVSVQLFTYISRDQAVQVIKIKMIIHSDTWKKKGQTLSRSGENMDVKVRQKWKDVKVIENDMHEKSWMSFSEFITDKHRKKNLLSCPYWLSHCVNWGSLTFQTALWTFCTFWTSFRIPWLSYGYRLIVSSVKT